MHFFRPTADSYAAQPASASIGESLWPSLSPPVSPSPSASFTPPRSPSPSLSPRTAVMPLCVAQCRTPNVLTIDKCEEAAQATCSMATPMTALVRVLLILFTLVVVIVVVMASMGVMRRTSSSTSGRVGSLPLAPSEDLASPILAIPLVATAVEAYLINRSNSFWKLCTTTTATAMMTALSPYTTAMTGSKGMNYGTLGGIDPLSAASIQRAGAAQVLQLAVYQGQTQYTGAATAVVQQDIAVRIMLFRLWAASSASISAGGPNGDVKQRQERGDIAWEAWLLHQAGAYFSAAPGQAAINSTQQLVEQFTTDYVENIYNLTTWPSTGYNKEIAQGLHPAAVMGLYGEAVFQQLWPNTYHGFFQFWDALLLGQHGSYEPDNAPDYGHFNLGMVMNMALYMNRLNRTDASDPHAYISDSLDVPRVLINLASEMMPNGNMVNYNRGNPAWKTLAQRSTSYYAWSSAGGSAPYVLYLGYSIYHVSEWLYTARKMERFLITMALQPADLLVPTETYPTNIRHFDVVGVVPPAIVSQLTWQRTSPNCSSSLLLCRGAPQSNTYLTPNKMILRAGTVAGSELNPYVFLSVTGAGQHANADQRMTLENTLYNATYITARAGTTGTVANAQVNQCNCILVAPSNNATDRSYPFVSDVSTFYNDIQLPSGGAYMIQGAAVQQLAGGNAYGELLYVMYEYPGVRTARQVVLTPTGIVVVVDSVYNTGLTSVPLMGGVTYRLWPNVTASGTNWALQAPLFGITSTAVIPATTNTSTLFWINNAPGRVVGLRSEPLTDFAIGAAGQTASTLYAYDGVSSNEGGVNTTHTFVSVLYPLSNPTLAAVQSVALQITVTVNSTDQSTVVCVPGQPAVSVPYLSLVPPNGSLVVWLSAQSLPNSTWGRSLRSWPDLSGNNNTFTSLNSQLPPTVSGTAMKGYPGVWFNGSQSQGMLGPAVFPITNDYTVSALFISPFSSGLRQGVVGSLTGAQHGLACIITSTNGHVLAVHNTVTLQTGVVYSTLAVNQPLLVTFTWQQSIGKGNLYFNGTLVASGSGGGNVAVTDPSIVVGFYNNPYQGYGYLTGFVSELLVFNYSLPTNSRLAMEQYIRASYGVLGTAAAKPGTLQKPSFM